MSSSVAVNYSVVTMLQHLAPCSRQCSVRTWQDVQDFGAEKIFKQYSNRPMTIPFGLHFEEKKESKAYSVEQP